MKSFSWRPLIFLFSFLALTFVHATVAPLSSDPLLALYPVNEMEGHPGVMTADDSYVYTVIGRQIASLSLRNPNGFVEIGRTAPFPGKILDMAVRDRVVYGLFNWNGDVHVFLMDFNNPTHPIEIDRRSLEAYADQIEISGSNVYVDQGYGLTIYDISIPTQMNYVASLPSHDYGISQLRVNGDRVVATASYFEGQSHKHTIYLYENVDGDVPREIGTYIGELNYTVVALGVFGDLVYVLWDHDDVENSRNRAIFQVIDFSSPGHTAIVGELHLSLDNGLKMFPVPNEDIVVDYPYVYVREEYGGQIQQIDVSDPAAPQLATVARSYEFPQDWLIWPPYLLVGSTRGGIEIHDLHRDGRLVRQGEYLGASTSMPIRAEVFGNRLYVLNRKGQLQVHSLKDPLNPQLLSAIDNRSTDHGIDNGLLADSGVVYLGSSLGIRIFSMSGSGKLSLEGTYPLYSQRYMAKTGDLLISTKISSVHILDVSDHVNPIMMGEWNGGGNAGFVIKDHFLFVALESGRLAKVDIADPSTPVQRATALLPGRPTTIALDGSLAYVGMDDGQFLVFDVDQAGEPELIGALETNLEEMRILHTGQGLAYVSGQNYPPPLYIIDARQSDAPRLAGRQFAGSSVLSVSAFEDLIYVSGWSEGVRIESLSETSSTVLTPDGGELQAGNGHVRYMVPTGVFTTDTELSHTELPEMLARHSPFISLGRPFEIAAIGLGSNADVGFEAPVSVTISSVKRGLTPIDEQTLSLFWFDGINWWPVQTSRYDPNNHTLQADIAGPGRYAVGGYAAYEVALPTVLADASQPDLNMAGVEITQATQNEAGDVPMVADKRTVVRVYVQTNSGSIPDVEVYLHGRRNGQLLPGSPLRSGPWLAPAKADRDYIGTSVNFELPASWTQGTVTLEVDIDPRHSIAEAMESNNAASIEVEFHNVPPLEVDVFPISISGRPTPPAIDYVTDRLLAMFPLSGIQTRLRPTLQMPDVACLDSDKEVALINLAAVKVADGASPSRVYYGYAGCGWGGIGYLGGRVSIGQYEPWIHNHDVMAHEIGHNFGLSHAGCTSDDDANYPYYNWLGQGIIGVHGFDSATHYVFQPNEHLNNMGYCSWFWDWISDYQYRALFNNQLVNGRVKAEHEEVLLLRLLLNKAGTATVEPTYILRAGATAEEPDSIYRLEWLDAAGNAIDSYGMPVNEIADAPGQVSIVVGVPMPQAVVGGFRIWKNDELIAERALLDNAQRPELRLDESDRGLHLSWQAGHIPTLIRFTEDSNSWMTLGIDVMGGEFEAGLPGRSGQLEVYFADTIGPSLLSYTYD